MAPCLEETSWPLGDKLTTLDPFPFGKCHNSLIDTCSRFGFAFPTCRISLLAKCWRSVLSISIQAYVTLRQSKETTIHQRKFRSERMTMGSTGPLSRNCWPDRVWDKPIDGTAEEPTVWLYLPGWGAILLNGVYTPIGRIHGSRNKGKKCPYLFITLFPVTYLGNLHLLFLQLWALQI